MSGIAALFHPDGRPVGPAAMAVMASQMRERGPEGSTTWRDGPAGLAHTRLTTTPEAALETQPFVEEDRDLAIVADVRLDNRDELIGILDLRRRDPAGVGDAELVLRAYQQWGPTCPTRLLGDFAVAIWDGRERRLFCARDHLGVKPLYYHHAPGRLLALASTPRALLALEEIPHRINEGRIADFLVSELEGIDKTSTFFEGVVRLPPAHTLTLDRSGAHQTRYWTLEPGPELRLPSDAAYDEAFLEIFTEAVRCRLRNHGTTGSMLSGGMDSGAIVAVARGLQAASGHAPLPTFSAIASAPDGCVESQSILAAQAMDGINAHTVSPATWSDLRPELDELLWTVEEPFDCHMTLLDAMYLLARREGATVVLDGIDGDNVMSEGSQLRCLLRSGHWLTARREASGLSRFWGRPHTATSLLFQAARQAFTPRPAKVAYHHWLDRRLDNRAEDRISESLISDAFAARVGLAGRMRTLAAHKRDRDGWRGLGRERARALDSAYLTAGLERYDRVAASAGIEPRHPFLDRRVIDFYLALPGDEKLHAGWPKALLRRSMAGLLPDAVRWRRGKQHLGYAYNVSLLDQDSARLVSIIEDQRMRLRDFIEVDRALPSDLTSEHFEDVRGAACLAAWLQRHDGHGQTMEPRPEHPW